MRSLKPKREPDYLRWACRILRTLHSRPRSTCDSTAYWLNRVLDRSEYLRRIRHRMRLAQDRRWANATEIVRQILERNLQELRYELDNCQRFMQSPKMESPTLRDLYAELRQLREEFGTMEYRPAEKTLVVTTDGIELEGTYLGAFELQIRLEQLDDDLSQVIRIVAVDPRAASSNPQVTHPHVSDERLCAGDATTPLRSALSQGRFSDAFLLVRSVLETYNPDSAYVTLENWDGIACHDCGYVAPADENYYCPCCEHDVCDDCSSYCRCCDTSLCRSCLTGCPSCDELTCESCMRACRLCGDKFCPACLEEDLCDGCQEKEKKDEGNENDENDSVRSAAASEAA